MASHPMLIKMELQILGFEPGTMSAEVLQFSSPFHKRSTGGGLLWSREEGVCIMLRGRGGYSGGGPPR